MAIKRYTADADTTITNAFKPDLSTRGTGSNMGASDVLEVFSLYAQANSSSSELERILIKFPATGTQAGYIAHDRELGNIPASGSVSFYLRMFNAKHSSTTPKSYDLVVSSVKISWDEGLGLDMEDFSDRDEANWIHASSASAGLTGWTNEGGDIHDDGTSSFTASFTTGFEDMGLDITPLVEQWIATTKSNYGMMIALSSSLEDGTNSYYTKKFFARGSQFFFKRPIIEARWDNSEKDDRGAFYYSSSLAPAADNLNTLYLYNYVRGQLKNIPGIAKTGSILVSLYSGSSDNTAPTASKLQLAAGGNVGSANELAATGGWVATGIYTASLAFTGSSTLTKVFDVWHTGTYASPDLLQYFTGTVKAASTSTSWPGSEINPNKQYVSKITNLKPIYSTANTSARFRLYTRKKDWCPTIYTKSSIKMPVSVIEEVFYKIVRANDGTEAVSYGTGSDKQTKLSYDASGSYFDFDLSMLEADNTYDIKFVYYLNGSYIEQPEKFRFKLVE